MSFLFVFFFFFFKAEDGIGDIGVTGVQTCALPISCDMCVRACPSACISLESARNEAGKKIIQNYTIDFGKCNWCRLCEEACPTNPKAVHHTMEYETMFLSRDDFKVTWLKDANGRPLVPVNAAGLPIGDCKDVPEKHLSVGVGAHKAAH